MATAPATGAHPLRFRPRWLRWAFFGALTLAAVDYGVLPLLVAVREDLHLVASASLWAVGVALILEVASVLCYTGLTQAVLPRDTHLPWSTQVRIDVSGLGVSRLLPGVGATAAGLRYRLMTGAGLAAAAAGSVVAVQALVSYLALAVSYALGAGASYSAVAQRPLLGVVGLVAVVLVSAAVVGARWLAVRPARARELVTSRSRLAERFQHLLGEMTEQVRRLIRDTDRTGAAVAFGLGNWLLDAVSLWVCLLAYGYGAAPGPLLTAYGFVQLLALLPISPGGLGVVESALVPLLIAFGAPTGVAVLGVVTWRLFQFWLPVPVGLASWASLRWGPWHVG